jgi:hypothetical protein
MSGYVWDLSGTDNRCQSYGPGHLIHWIHFNQLHAGAVGRYPRHRRGRRGRARAH